MDLGTRLKMIRKDAGETQEGFSRQLGVTHDAYKKYESNTVKPINGLLKLICLKYKVNENWLSDGVGEMYLPKKEYKNNLMGLAGKLTDELADGTGKHAEFKEWLATELLGLPDEHVDALKQMFMKFSNTDIEKFDNKKEPS